MAIELGSIIWIAVKPIIKIYFIIATGFFLSRKNVLTIETSRNISDIVITVLIPCLTFFKIVANVSDGDIKDIGVICLTSVLLFSLGGLGSFIIRYVTKAPNAWFGGLLAAGILPNVQDITVAMLQTMNTGVIFTEAEADKGVTYVIIFFMMFTLVLFNLGGFRLVEWDFIRERRRKEKEESEDHPIIYEPQSAKKEVSSRQSDLEMSDDNGSSISMNEPIALRTFHDTSSIESVHTHDTRHSSLRMKRYQTLDDVISDYRQDNPPTSTLAKIITTEVGVTTEDIKGDNSSKFVQKYHLNYLLFFMKNCLRPCSIALIVSLVIAFIPWLKALFVHTTVSMRDAPDQLPPLSFIMDYTSYVSAACIPFALLLLGSTIAKIEVTVLPKNFWRTALALTILRLAILPILGVLWAKALVAMGWVSKDDKVLLFVLMVTFGLPSMTSIIYFTAFNTSSSDSDDRLQMNCVSIIFLIQYPVLFVSLPILVSYVLKVELGF